MLAAAAALFLWLGAEQAGVMFANCDPAVRPGIVPMVAFILSIPFVASGAVLFAVPVSVGAGWIGSRLFPGAPSWLTYAIVIAGGVVVAIASYAIAFALGARPTPTACVI